MRSSVVNIIYYLKCGRTVVKSGVGGYCTTEAPGASDPLKPLYYYDPCKFRVAGRRDPLRAELNGDYRLRPINRHTMTVDLLHDLSLDYSLLMVCR